MTRLLLPFLIVCSLTMTSGCAMKSAKPAVDPSQQQSATTKTGENDSLRGSKNGIVEETITSAPQTTVTLEPLAPLDKPTLAGLKVIPFDYDQHLLSEEARNTIAANAAILKAFPKGKFQLAGYCDERGSDQYNIALGERRSEAVRSYLIELGIDAGRLETVSYGEEQPVDNGHDEAAWQKNRRVEFVLRP